MSEESNSKRIKDIWRTLKRALIATPDIQNDFATCNINSSNIDNTIASGSNSSNESIILTNEHNTDTLNNVTDTNDITPKNKKQKLNITTDVNQIGLSEETSFMEIMKNLLSCSICLEVNTYSNQCPNGHLICITCSGRLQQVSGDLSCPVCRISLKQGLHRSLLAEQLTSELPASCRFCTKVMPVKCIKRHETEECSKRKVPCKYNIFGCTWTGIEENHNEHVESCSVADKTVGTLHETVKHNINNDIQLLQIPLQIWKSLITKLRTQAVGSRILLRQTTINKMVNDDPTESLFKSPVIRVPFSCCSLHGFYIELKIKKYENKNEKLYYNIKSENKTKITLNYFISNFKIDESLNLNVIDNLHNHHFESNHKESALHELKLVSLDCDKSVPELFNLDNMLVEICFISERERSERTHGILSSNDEDEVNPFVSTSGSDSNVVFTLFSPTSSGTRSINTSNAATASNEDGTILSEVEPSHEDDIIITVTDNVESGDDISTENRDHILTRNNHGFVAVPTVLFNPNPSILPYSPYQIDNSIIPNINYLQQNQTIIPQSGMRITQNREAVNIEPELINHNGTMPIEQQEHHVNFNRQLNPRASESIQTNDSNRQIRESLHMSLFYPPQTIVTPYLSNSVSPLAIRPQMPRNILVRPRSNVNQISLRQSRLINNADESNGFVNSTNANYVNGDNNNVTIQPDDNINDVEYDAENNVNYLLEQHNSPDDSDN